MPVSVEEFYRMRAEPSAAPAKAPDDALPRGPISVDEFYRSREERRGASAPADHPADHPAPARARGGVVETGRLTEEGELAEYREKAGWLTRNIARPLERGLATFGQGAAAARLDSLSRLRGAFDRIDAGGGMDGRDGENFGEAMGYARATPKVRAERRARLEEDFIGAAGEIKNEGDRLAAIPRNPAVKAASEAKDFDTAWHHFKRDPLAFIGHVSLESAPMSAVSLAGAAAAARGGRGMAAGAAGAGLGSAAADYASSIIEGLQQEGIDTGNPAAVAAAAGDPALMERARSRALSHATVVGAFDAASLGVAGKTLAPRALAHPVARGLANVAAQAPVQGTLGAAGEYLGSRASGKEVGAGELMGEFFGEFGTAPADVATATFVKGKGARPAIPPAAPPQPQPQSQPPAPHPASPPVSPQPVTEPQAPAAPSPAAPPDGQTTASLHTLMADPRPLDAILEEQKAQAKAAAAVAEREVLTEFDLEKGARVVMRQEVGQPFAVTVQRSYRDGSGLPLVVVKADDGSVYHVAPGEASFSSLEGDGSRGAPVAAAAPEQVEVAAARAETAPTPAQKEAGNYRKGHLKLQGLDISLENPKGSTRSGMAPDGRPWSVEMPAHYGSIKRTTAADGDPVDVYIGDHPESGMVVVVDQIDPGTGRFDEHKAILGTTDANAAAALYDASFSDGSGPRRRGAVTPMTMAAFKEWLHKGDTTRPLSYRTRDEILAEARQSVEDGAASLGLVLSDAEKGEAARRVVENGLDPQEAAIAVAEAAAIQVYRQEISETAKEQDHGEDIPFDAGTAPEPGRRVAEAGPEPEGQGGTGAAPAVAPARDEPRSALPPGGRRPPLNEKSAGAAPELPAGAPAAASPEGPDSPRPAPPVSDMSGHPGLLMPEAYGETRRAEAIAAIEADLQRVKEGTLPVGKFHRDKTRAAAIRRIRKELAEARSAPVSAFAADHLAEVMRAFREGLGDSIPQESLDRWSLDRRGNPVAPGRAEALPAGVSAPSLPRQDTPSEKPERNGRADSDRSVTKQGAVPPAPVAGLRARPDAPRPPSRGRTKKVSWLEASEAYFRPGRVIPSHGGGFDRVIAFERASDSIGWQVRVIQSDQDGNPLPGVDARTHATIPFRSYRQMENWYRKNVETAGGATEPQEDAFPTPEQTTDSSAATDQAPAAPSPDRGRSTPNRKALSAARNARQKALDHLEALRTDPLAQWRASARNHADTLVKRMVKASRDRPGWLEAFRETIDALDSGTMTLEEITAAARKNRSKISSAVAEATTWLEQHPRPEGADTVPFTLETPSGRTTRFELRNDASSMGEVRDNLGKLPAKVFYALRRSGAGSPGLRAFGIPREADPPLFTFRNDLPLKRHPDYRAAKAGDREAAARLVSDLVKPETIDDAKRRFGAGAVYVPVIAEEASGRNKIPGALAQLLAETTGATEATGIVQSNRAFHTGANPMERLIPRPSFEGEVTAGARYVLVDDVNVLGGSLAELANHIQANGGKVAGVVTLVNASRSGVFSVQRQRINEIERRYGDVVRDQFGIEPAALTADEAAYILNFRDADALRDRISKARSERGQRLLQKGVRPPAPDQGRVASPSEDERDDGDGGPALRMRPAAARHLPAIVSDLRRHLDARGLRHVRLVTPDSIAGGMADAAYFNRVIAVALDTADKTRALDHEAVHALRRIGLFRPGEWAALEKMAREQWIDRYGIRDRYAHLGLSETEMVEEAIADAFSDWAAGGYRPGGIVIRLFNLIRNLLNEIAAAFGARGFHTAESVFGTIAEGRIGRRDQGSPRATSGRDFNFDAFEAGPAVNAPRETVERAAAEATRFMLRRQTLPLGFEGEERGLTLDAGLFTRWFVHPRSIAALHKAFVPVWRTSVRQVEMRDELAAALTREIEPYMAMPAEARRKVDAALELGRLRGEVILPGMFPAIANEGEEHAQLSRPGEEIRLSDDEFAAYQAVRKAMDAALDLFRNQVIEEGGLDPEAAGTAEAIGKLASEAGAPDQTARLNQIAGIVREIEQAKRQGYVPFQRWGQVGVAVRRDGDLDPVTGDVRKETVYFEMVEVDGLAQRARRWIMAGSGRPGNLASLPEVRAAMERAKAMFPDLPADAYQVFEVAPNTPMAGQVHLADLDMLAQVARLEPQAWDAVREGLQSAIQQRGFRSHFFGARNVPGYSADFERAIADYVVGIAGYLARRRHAAAWEKAIADIPRTMPKLKEYAQRYHEYTQNPAEEWQNLRQAGFFYYLAGSLASAAVNLTQVPIVTMPYLGQFHGHGAVMRELTRAYRDALKMVPSARAWRQFFSLGTKAPEYFDVAKAPDDMREALQQAWDDGFFIPLNTYEMMSMARSRSANLRGMSAKTRNFIDRTAVFFTLAERINRLVTFIAARRLARHHPQAIETSAQRVLAGNALARSDELLRGFTPEKFAKWAVDETHYRMGKVNRPTVMRGPGAAMLQFKGFVMQTLELFYRLGTRNGREGRRAVLLMLAIIWGVSGLWGLPFAEDLRTLVETLWKKLTGLDLDIKTEFREMVVELTGSPRIAEILSQGGGRLAGVDLARIGMGHIIPNSLEEAGGIPVAMTLGRLDQMIEHAKHGDHLVAAGEAMPKFAKDVIHGYAWGEDGVRSQETGRVVIPAGEITAAQQMLKSIGFTPRDIANLRQTEFAKNRANRAAGEVKADFYGALARLHAKQMEAGASGDAAPPTDFIDKIADVHQQIAEFNEGRPAHERVVIDRQTLKKRISEELRGAKARDRSAPRQARSRRERIDTIYGR